MRRVAQRDFEAGDCGIACVAMVADTTYEKAHAAALALGLRSKNGDYYTSHKNLEELLLKLGKRCSRQRFRSMREVIGPAIVKVNLREGGKYWHWVVAIVRGHDVVVLDPKPGKVAPIRSFRGLKGTGTYLCVT